MDQELMNSKEITNYCLTLFKKNSKNEKYCYYKFK